MLEPTGSFLYWRGFFLSMSKYGSRKGINMDKHILDDNEQKILQVLSGERFDYLNAARISKKLYDYNVDLRSNAIEHYANNLYDLQLVRREKEPPLTFRQSKVSMPNGMKPMLLPMAVANDVSYRYQINDKGLQCIDDGFIIKNELDYHAETAHNTSLIVKNTATTNEILLSQGKTLDDILMAMGAQHQRSLQEIISIKGLLKEYIELTESDQPDKGDKIISFLKKLSGDLVIELIKEYVKYKFGFFTN